MASDNQQVEAITAGLQELQSRDSLELDKQRASTVGASSQAVNPATLQDPSR